MDPTELSNQAIVIANGRRYRMRDPVLWLGGMRDSIDRVRYRHLGRNI